MNIDKTHASTLLQALQDAIRYAHIDDKGYDIRKYRELHNVIVRKVYRSKEMRDHNWIPRSVLEGSDLGLFCAVKDVVLGRSKSQPIQEIIKASKLGLDEYNRQKQA